MAKKTVLKHMQENGVIATRQTVRTYTHVLLRKIDKEAAIAVEMAKYPISLVKADAEAMRVYQDNIDDIAAGPGGQIRYKRDQGGYKKFADGSYRTYTQDQWHYDHVVEWHAKYGTTLEGYKAWFKAQADKWHEGVMKRIADEPDTFYVISWHSRADLAKPDHQPAGALFRVEAINGGVR